MVILGITGLPGSGKSTVAKIFQNLGAYVIDVDEIGHELLKPGGCIWHKVVERFGMGIIGEGGEINRKALAQIAFSNPVNFKLLNLIMHPEMGEEISKMIRGIRERDPEAVVVLDGAIIVEAMFSRYDKLILVICEDKERESRLIKKGLSLEDMRKRASYQMHLEKKMAIADYLVDNSGEIRRTKEMVKEIWKEIRGDR